MIRTAHKNNLIPSTLADKYSAPPSKSLAIWTSQLSRSSCKRNMQSRLSQWYGPETGVETNEADGVGADALIHKHTREKKTGAQSSLTRRPPGLRDQLRSKQKETAGSSPYNMTLKSGAQRAERRQTVTSLTIRHCMASTQLLLCMHSPRTKTRSITGLVVAYPIRGHG